MMARLAATKYEERFMSNSRVSVLPLSQDRTGHASRSDSRLHLVSEPAACGRALHIEDLAVARTTDWVLEQFYTVVNDRYQDERAILFTADVEAPPALAEHVGGRTYSRLIEMCGDPILMYGADRRLQRFGVT